MDAYVLAHHGEDAGRRRLALLDEFHGPLTRNQLEAAQVQPGWQCLEIGAGSGAITAWLAEKVGATGRVLAIDVETHSLEPLRSELVEVLRADLVSTHLPEDSFDLVLARMLLLRLPDPAQVCRRLIAAAASGGCLVVQDADFRPVALEGATDAEQAGLAVMNARMRSAGLHIALGPELEGLLEAAGAEVLEGQAAPSPGRGGGTAALITAATLEHSRADALAAGASDTAIASAIAALRDPERGFTGPTQWIVRCRVPAQ